MLTGEPYTTLEDATHHSQAPVNETKEGRDSRTEGDHLAASLRKAGNPGEYPVSGRGGGHRMPGSQEYRHLHRESEEVPE
ncbi:hypothetical protein GCM10011359_31160 [Nesterenkonia alkaliphila]|nr:hypothetical protein GCM10011359_31160 [Nesterenkonia alkaliphila]